MEYGLIGRIHVIRLCIGHVDFMLLSIFSWCWVTNTNVVSGGIWDLPIKANAEGAGGQHAGPSGASQGHVMTRDLCTDARVSRPSGVNCAGG